MAVDEEFKQIVSDIEIILENKDNVSIQQIGTEIVNSLVPSHYNTIDDIYQKYPELEDLEDIGASIEIMTDDELWPETINDAVNIFNNIKQKYSHILNKR